MLIWLVFLNISLLHCPGVGLSYVDSTEREASKPSAFLPDGTIPVLISPRFIMPPHSDPSYEGEKPPIFLINLSLPPADRYVSLARIYGPKMRALTSMFDEIIESISPKIPVNLVHFLGRICLRRLYTAEETEEIRGISVATGIELYLLISMNVVLDLLMGCTSGGVRVQDGGSTKMLHFRSLDWSMDPLRDLIVQLDFVRDPEPQKVLASSITYVGLVGVLTGVRKDLSASLNFRPVHDPSRDFGFYLNHLLVLLGLRQSIPSLLRQCIIPASSASRRGTKSSTSTLDDIVSSIPSRPTTAAYLIFSDGVSTVTMEKDHRTAVVCSSSSFIVTTNHDQYSDKATRGIMPKKMKNHSRGLSLISGEIQSMQELLDESNERLECIQSKWDNKVKRHRRAQRDASIIRASKSSDFSPPVMRTRSSFRLRERHNSTASYTVDSEVAIKPDEAVAWLTTYPVLNECTHYASIMDPTEGKVFWAEKYEVESGE